MIVEGFVKTKLRNSIYYVMGSIGTVKTDQFNREFIFSNKIHGKIRWSFG